MVNRYVDDVAELGHVWSSEVGLLSYNWWTVESESIRTGLFFLSLSSRRPQPAFPPNTPFATSLSVFTFDQNRPNPLPSPLN